jgi:hypothetical protein
MTKAKINSILFINNAYGQPNFMNILVRHFIYTV